MRPSHQTTPRSRCLNQTLQVANSTFSILLASSKFSTSLRTLTHCLTRTILAGVLGLTQDSQGIVDADGRNRLDLQADLGAALEAISETDPDGLVLLHAACTTIWANPKARAIGDDDSLGSGSSLAPFDAYTLKAPTITFPRSTTSQRFAPRLMGRADRLSHRAELPLPTHREPTPRLTSWYCCGCKESHGTRNQNRGTPSARQSQPHTGRSSRSRTVGSGVQRLGPTCRIVIDVDRVGV